MLGRAGWPALAALLKDNRVFSMALLALGSMGLH